MSLNTVWGMGSKRCVLRTLELSSSERTGTKPLRCLIRAGALRRVRASSYLSPSGAASITETEAARGSIQRWLAE